MSQQKLDFVSINAKHSCDAMVYYVFDSEDNYALRPEFKTYACKKCGKLDLVESLQGFVPAGLLDGIKVPDTDFLNTHEHLFLVRDKASETLREKFDDAFHFFALPDYPWSICHPRHILSPDSEGFYLKDNPVSPVPHTGVGYSSTGSRCRKCQRLRDCCLLVEYLNIPDTFTIGSAYVPNSFSHMPQGNYSWIFREDAAEVLLNLHLIGLLFQQFAKLRETRKIRDKLVRTQSSY